MKALYEIYRDYMKHEDDLINHRSDIAGRCGSAPPASRWAAVIWG